MVFMLTKRDKWQWAAVLIAACILTYANGLGGGFTYDDKAIVRDLLLRRSSGRRHGLPAGAPSFLRGPVVDPRPAGGRVPRGQRAPACRSDPAAGGALP